MFTISQIARRFGLSRSTLLYWDRVGLLTPSLRSAANYRLYSRADLTRMERIMLYREIGLSLQDITSVLSSRQSGFRALLDRRLEELDREIQIRREQQRMIARLIKAKPSSRERGRLDKQGWVEILRASGMSDDEMDRWHVEFERRAPDGHQEFLESLGISATEIKKIRTWSRRELRS